MEKGSSYVLVEDDVEAAVRAYLTANKLDGNVTGAQVRIDGRLTEGWPLIRVFVTNPSQ